jgi:hypothetical protein
MPKPMRITHLPQRKVEMRVLGTRVAGRADIAHDLPLSDLLTFPDAFGIAFKMRIVEQERACRAQLIEGDTTRLAIKESHDGPITRRKHGRAMRSGNIQSFMAASPGAWIYKGVLQLSHLDPSDRNT